MGRFHRARPSLSAAVRVRLRQSQFERTYYITEGKESQESTLSRSAGGHEGRPYLAGGYIGFRMIRGAVGAGLVPARVSLAPAAEEKEDAHAGGVRVLLV